MKNIVFQGDSITDFGRNYADPYNVGSGYVLFIQAILNRKYPQQYTCFNRGHNGDRISDLYAYRDETPAILEALFALMDRFGDRVLSLCGNHEHAHIGGRCTQKFHSNEAEHLEAQLSPSAVVELRRRFASWPVVITRHSRA